MGAFHRMDRLQSRLDKKYALSPEWALRHREFHSALVGRPTSPILREIRDNLFDRAQRYRRISSLYRPGPRNKEAEHRAILEAALSRDTPLACDLIERHIRQTTENILRYASELLSND